MKLSRTAAVIAVGAVLFTGGCSSDKSTSSQTTTSTVVDGVTNTPADTPEFILHNGAVVSGPSTISVKVGDTVKFKVISDKDDQIHIHGYDKEVDLKSGEYQTVEFKATIPGKFEIEIHSNDSLVTNLEVS